MNPTANWSFPTTIEFGAGRIGELPDQVRAHVKKVIFHPQMMPAIVIRDAELTVGMPPIITPGTGLDAFAHCLEAYCAPFYHPLADGVALEGMRPVKEYLPRAFATPTDIEARGNMLAAAAMGASAFQKGLGAIHALSHPIGALFDTHHGMTNAVVVPAVLAAKRAAIESKMARLSTCLGLAGGFDGFLGFVRDLRALLNVPDTLTGFGVPRADFDRIRDMALLDPTAGGNPLAMTRELAGRMLDAAFGA